MDATLLFGLVAAILLSMVFNQMGFFKRDRSRQNQSWYYLCRDWSTEYSV